MTSEISDIRPQLRKVTGWSIALGVLLVIAGAFAITLPLSTGLAVAIWLGWIYTFVAIANLVYAWQSRDEGTIIFILKLLVALLYLGAGIFLLTNPLKGVLTLTLILGIFLLVEGAFELILAFKLRSLSPSWVWVLGHGAVTLILGILIWSKWLSNSAWVLGLLVGINLITSGISRIMLSLAARLVLSPKLENI
jgi:uncharacterized membrane protein HdeD (DUF308 family)